MVFNSTMDSTRKAPRCGPLIREVRRRHKLGQAALAHRLGTSQAAISRIERDLVSPSIETLSRILEAMGETILVSTAPLSQPAPGAGNVPIAELRADYEETTSSERLEQAGELSLVATELARGADA
jgi:transcriptional regulator with XRE-family HTH domain